MCDNHDDQSALISRRRKRKNGGIFVFDWLTFYMKRIGWGGKKSM